MLKRTTHAILSAASVMLITLASYVPLSANTPEQTVVFYLSGDRIQAGIAGEGGPRINMPAVIATSGGGGPMIGMQRTATYYGDDALSRTGVTTTYAVQSQRIVDRNAFEKIVRHLLARLAVEPEDVAIVINETASGPDSEREQTTQLFFESFNVPAFFMTPHFSSWAMASQTSSQSIFAETLITRDEYDEIGPTVIHRKSQR